MGQLAEDAGLESLWVGDHVVMVRGAGSRYPYASDGAVPGIEPSTPFYEAFTALAWLAASTTRVAIGTAVLVLPQREPLLVAKTAASLDALSGGRLRLGVGAGWLAEEMEALGWEFGSRGRRMDEAIGVLRACWSGEPEASAGEFFSRPRGLTCYPTPTSRPSIPVLVGGTSEAAIARAARIGDGWLALASVEHPDEGALERGLAAISRGRAEGAAPPHNVLRLVDSAATPKALASLRRLARAGFDELVVEVPWDDLDETARSLEAVLDAVS
jgi:probable F420-dependent oxidoreductase